MAFILATPHCSAFLSAGDPVTREPMSSLSSVRYWKACESIIASPAIFTSAGFVPSSSGPFGAGRLSARAIPAPPQENPSATTATLAKIRRICLLPHAFRAQETLSRSRDAPAEERFRSSAAAGCRFCTRKPVEGCTPVTTAQPGFPFTFTRPRPHPTLPFVTTPSLSGPFPCLRISSLLLLLALVCVSPAQEPAQKPVEKRADKKAEKTAPPEKTENPAHIELLETRCRFEASGDSRKEVHARVHINSELGVRQFARLNFDYNRSFESVDIPLVHIIHASGGTADILPSAIIDHPHSAVINAPPTKMCASNPSVSSASNPPTSSNTASSLSPSNAPWPPTSGSTTLSTAPESSPRNSSRSTCPPRRRFSCTLHPNSLTKSLHPKIARTRECSTVGSTPRNPILMRHWKPWRPNQT